MRYLQSVRRGLTNQRRRFLEEKPRWTGILTPEAALNSVMLTEWRALPGQV